MLNKKLNSARLFACLLVLMFGAAMVPRQALATNTATTATVNTLLNNQQWQELLRKLLEELRSRHPNGIPNDCSPVVPPAPPPKPCPPPSDGNRGEGFDHNCGKGNGP